MNVATLTRAAAPTDANWRLSGRCLAVDPDVMHPDARDFKGHAKAKAICDGCPVQRECLDDAFRVGDWEGVRGGMTGKERREMAKRDGQLKSSPPMGCTECGLPRLQHHADDHRYQVPDMDTIHRRVAQRKQAAA
ncbi:WhiB family transcriptional regulator [Micromonospora sp. DPT]|uniref:WhiB family transcriptional regulator n=1 Tax=Micromonospora sp. DPT TaxID=3142975 RepID=UPI00320BA4C1